MRVALVHLRQSGTGGTERYLNQMARYLCDRGDEVTIVCRSYESAPHPAVKLVRLRSPVPGSVWRIWAFAKAVERHVAEARYGVVFGLGKAWSHDVVRLGGGCHQTYLDLAHERHAKAWWKAPFGGWLKQRVALEIEKRALAAGAYRRVIVNAEMVKRDVMVRHAVPAEKIAVVYNGVDLERFDRRRHSAAAERLRGELGFARDERVVLFLGTGYGRKGLWEFLEAFAGAHRRRLSLRGLIVGYDSAQSSYERRAASLGLGDAVRFVGGRRDPEVCYAASDVYVLPTHYDPFANSTLEALASGLPVITTTHNGGAEVLTGETGAVIEPTVTMVTCLTDEILAWADRCADARVAARALAAQHPENRTAAESAAVLDQM